MQNGLLPKRCCAKWLAAEVMLCEVADAKPVLCEVAAAKAMQSGAADAKAVLCKVAAAKAMLANWPMPERYCMK